MPNGKCPPSLGGVDKGELLAELEFDIEAAILGAVGWGWVGWGDVPTTVATFASNVWAFVVGDLQRSLSHCIVDDPVTLTDGGVTDGGVNGDRIDCLAEGSQRLGSEMNIFDGAKANLDDVDEESSDDLLLLIEATVMSCWVFGSKDAV